MLNWDKLLSEKRLDDIVGVPPGLTSAVAEPSWLAKTRSAAERDYDRVRFAAPVRRLADKTQVFPLERNDSVRNRLTHSEEVSAIARSVGTHIAHSFHPARGIKGHERRLPAMLAAVGLAHDLGNPPFGHQGEEAIRHWFRQREALCFGNFREGKPPRGLGGVELEGALDMGRACRANPALKEDFLRFEGNAQTMRLVMRLQSSSNGFGLNLTCGTLASLMKYVVPSDAAKKSGPVASRKVGYFASEADLISKAREEVGLGSGVRHPLAHVLEACDDIAYSVLDTEDTVKKGLVSFPDLIAYLEAAAPADEAVQYVAKRSSEDHVLARKGKLAPSELNDVSMQKFRVHAINVLVSALIQTWGARYDAIVSGDQDESLLDVGPAAKLVEVLKRFDKEHAFRHTSVLGLEVDGFNKLNELMSMLWRGIVERESYDKPASKRTSPFADLAYSHISQNYRQAFEQPPEGGSSLPIRYRELQLLTDMVSGMTDSYAVYLHRRLGEFHVGASQRQV
ncbi:dGTP triphosphohydrolase [Muricoccus vinaceus]|uniref:dGTP triphosphohydrolase n=1 Tax=Muricoccus vinaceus TaxID=424704 RepID=A0ABV6IWJ4_9PROT